jgi:thioredoxin 1
LEPILKELESTYTDVEVIGINIDQDSSIANKYEVKSIPTLIFILNKEVKRVLVGVNSKEVLENALRSILSEVK